MPSDKRARQRAGREMRLAEEAKAKKRRKSIRNTVVIGVIAIVIIVVVVIASSGGPKKPAKSSTTTTTVAKSKNATLQAAANKLAVAAGCPASTSARVNTQKYSAAPAMTIDTTKTYTATIKTTAGTFAIGLDAQAAPVTVNSFVFLAQKGYFHCVIFHRVIPGFVDQTGDPTGTGKGSPGYEFANENIPKAYATGDVAMANSGANTNGSQFFVVVAGGASTLDSDLSSGGYSLFGQVTSGLNVVNTINTEGTSAGTPAVTQRMLSVTISVS